MMSPENIPPPPENDAATRKTAPPKQPHEQPQKCPRCDSANTKFCYYNNYSLTQPRHFCKTCRRYWTRGGALRNVPIGGGCRKTKKLRTSSSSTTTSNSSPTAKMGGGVEFGHGFKFLNPNLNPSSLGCTTPAAAGMEFQLGGFSLPKLHPATAGVYTQYVTSSVPPPGHGTGAGPYFGLDLLAGLNYSPSSPPPPPPPAAGNENPISISSIESLSSINQEMHWKLQQQRLAMIYGRGDDHEEHKINDQEKLHHQDTTQGGSINLFKNLEINNNNNNNNNGGERKMNVGPTEWLFDQIQTSSAANHGNYGTNCTSNNVNEVAGSNLHGVWGDLNHHNHHQQQLQFHGLE